MTYEQQRQKVEDTLKQFFNDSPLLPKWNGMTRWELSKIILRNAGIIEKPVGRPKVQDFEEYLEDLFIKNHSDGVLDDEMGDMFEKWLQGLDTNDVIEYGEMYGQYIIKIYEN